MAFKVPEQYRIKFGPLASTKAFGNNGAFFLPNSRGFENGKSAPPLKVIASDGAMPG